MLLLLLACTETAPAWGPPDEVGPYGSGATTLSFVDDRGKALVAEVWYPASYAEDRPPDPYPEVPVAIEARRNAAPDRAGGPYRLIAFSHGYGAIRYQSAFLTEWLASHGYVVVAVDHPGNTLLDLDESRDGQVAAERPDDVIASVDALLERVQDPDSLLYGLVDDPNYVMSGHSFGGWTTLVVAGGAIDIDGFQALCDEDPDFGYCDKLAGMPEGIEPPAPDPRAVMALPMTPAGWYTFDLDGSGLASVVPSLLLGGEEDERTPLDEEVGPTWESLGSPKSFGLLAQAGHYAFSDICLLAPFITDECEEEAGGWIAMDKAHALVRTLVTAWLDVEFRGDARSQPWLEPDAMPDAWTWEVVTP